MGRVLIVNENTRIRGDDRRRLTGAGFRVREADDIYSASDILREGGVDAVLMEVATEGGRLFADVVGHFHPDIPVLLVGTFPAAEARGSGTRHDRRAGPADLLGKVATAVGRRRAPMEKIAAGPLPGPS